MHYNYGTFRPRLISGFGSDFCLHVKDAYSKKNNTINIQLGRMFNQICLILEPEYDDSQNNDDRRMCYKPASAWGYKLIK